MLETEHYAISLSAQGIIKEPKENLHENPGEWLQEGVEVFDDDEWVHFETTLFINERILSTTEENGIFYIQFDDFTLKIVPHENGDDIEGLHNKDHWSYNYILGCDRHLKNKCPHCGGNGEILLDFVSDYIVRCKNCKLSTWAGMNLIDAITDWNNGEVQCNSADIVIE